MAEVKFENVTKRYGNYAAVNNVSFDLKNGEFFTILGPSGAGKTTSLQLVAGIKSPDEGQIYIGGEPVNNIPPQKRDVAMAFENYSLYPHFTVYENIAFPLKAPQQEKLSSAEIRERVEEIAGILGIGQLLDRQPKQLSGGQKQRVSLARAMIRRPEVYLLDEPIAHLDAKLKVTARTTLKKLAHKLGITIMYVTHDYKDALGLSDRIMIMRDGRIEQIGTSEEVFLSPANDFVGTMVGDPPINLIDGEIRRENGNMIFRADDQLSFTVSKDFSDIVEKVEWEENGRSYVRIGIRPACLRLGIERMSDNSFELPVYSVEHETDSSVVVFELSNTFLLVQTQARFEIETFEKAWIDFEQSDLHFFNKTISLSKK